MAMIDVHAHWFPPALVSEFAARDLKVWPAHPESLSARADELAADGFAVQVLGLGHNQPYHPDAATAQRCARFANDLYAGAVGGPFAAFGAIPLPHPDFAAAEAVRCLDSLGFAGIGVGTTALDASLDDPRFADLWSELDRRSAVVFVHPVGVIVTGLDAFLMGPKYGGPLESTLAATRLAVSGVTRRHPRIRWIISPMGGALGFLWRRFEEMTQSLGQDEWLATDPRTELAKMYYDTTLSDDPSAIRYFADIFGSSQLVLGTDSPRVRAGEWASRVTEVPGFSDAERAGLLSGTAAALGIGPRT